MEAVVTEGTASALRTDAYTAAAKTGSAEFETGKETHAWFTGFARRVAQIGGYRAGGRGRNRGRAAAPIARQLFDITYQDKEGETACFEQMIM